LRDVPPYSLVEIDGHFGVACCLVIKAMEALIIPESSVNFYQTSGRSIPEDILISTGHPTMYFSISYFKHEDESRANLWGKSYATIF
jgi:hypothetical protein